MSNKIYKGYELIKAIADGEIKDGTKIIPHYPNNDCTVYYFIWQYGYLDACYKSGIINSDINVCVFLDNNRTFEVVENLIDIQNIEEMNETHYVFKSGVENQISEREQQERKMINMLIKSVKQLDKKIKED